MEYNAVTNTPCTPAYLNDLCLWSWIWSPSWICFDKWLPASSTGCAERQHGHTPSTLLTAPCFPWAVTAGLPTKKCFLLSRVCQPCTLHRVCLMKQVCDDWTLCALCIIAHQQPVASKQSFSGLTEKTVTWATFFNHCSVGFAGCN